MEKEEVPINKNEISKLKEKVDTLKLVIQVMAEQILILEAKMNTVKMVETHEEVIQQSKGEKKIIKLMKITKQERRTRTVQLMRIM